MKIRIDRLEVAAIIGVRANERKTRQTLLVDIELEIDTPAADRLESRCCAPLTMTDAGWRSAGVHGPLPECELRLVLFR